MGTSSGLGSAGIDFLVAASSGLGSRVIDIKSSSVNAS